MSVRRNVSDFAFNTVNMGPKFAVKYLKATRWSERDDKIRNEYTSCNTKEELESALQNKTERILLDGDLYNEMYEVVIKSKNGKSLKKIGAFGVVNGLCTSTPLGLIVWMGGGVLSLVCGTKNDSFVNYKCEIDEDEGRILLTMSKKALKKMEKEELRRLQKEIKNMSK